MKKKISSERAAQRAAERAAELAELAAERAERAAERAEAQDVLPCGCPDRGFDECGVHGESGTLAEGSFEDPSDEDEE